MHKFKFTRQLEMVSFATSDKIWRIIIILVFFALFNKSKNCAGFFTSCVCAYAKIRKSLRHCWLERAPFATYEEAWLYQEEPCFAKVVTTSPKFEAYVIHSLHCNC